MNRIVFILTPVICYTTERLFARPYGATSEPAFGNAGTTGEGDFLHYRHREALSPSPGFRAAHDRLVADHGKRPGVLEYLLVLQLAAEKTVEQVEPVLRAHLARAGKWRAREVAKSWCRRRGKSLRWRN